LHPKQSKKPKVAVVLSTYNGETFLREQLYSIDAQQYDNWDLWIRDDGSTDATLDIIRAYQKDAESREGHRRIMVLEGNNVGVVNSFLTLLSGIPDDYDIFAFCDQDDIWLPEKLDRAVGAYIHYRVRKDPDTRPWLYHSRQILMDEAGQSHGMSVLPRRTGFDNAIIQNQVVGCSMVIDDKLKNLLIKGLDVGKDEKSQSKHTPRPEGIIMHDWWCYLTASQFGVMVFDDRPVIRYRRHDTSKTPVSVSPIRAWINRMIAMRSKKWNIRHIIDQVELFYHCYCRDGRETVNGCHKESLLSLIQLKEAGIRTRLQYVLRTGHHRSTALETLLFRLLILFKRY